MTLRSRLPLALPLAAFALSACVSEGPFPSLALRPEERAMSRLDPARPPVEVPSDPALRQRILGLRQQATGGERAFDAAIGPAETAIARAGAQDTESWVEAQQALSRLEAARGPVSLALGELDRLATARADLPMSTDDFEAIRAMIAEVRRVAERQEARLAALRTRLSR